MSLTLPTLDPRPSTLDPRPATLDPRPSTQSPKPKAQILTLNNQTGSSERRVATTARVQSLAKSFAEHWASKGDTGSGDTLSQGEGKVVPIARMKSLGDLLSLPRTLSSDSLSSPPPSSSPPSARPKYPTSWARQFQALYSR